MRVARDAGGRDGLLPPARDAGPPRRLPVPKDGLDVCAERGACARGCPRAGYANAVFRPLESPAWRCSASAGSAPQISEALAATAPLRVMLVGDSEGKSMLPGLKASGRAAEPDDQGRGRHRLRLPGPRRGAGPNSPRPAMHPLDEVADIMPRLARDLAGRGKRLPAGHRPLRLRALGQLHRRSGRPTDGGRVRRSGTTSS